MPMSHFPNGFSNGVSIKGLPLLNSYSGSVFWVDSVTGSNGNSGSYSNPFATINKGLEKCTANKGDIIMLKPGHYEDLADTSSSGAIDIDVAGVSLIGLGTGTSIPRIDFNHGDSDFLIGANNVFIQNVNFEATVTTVKIGVAIEAGVVGTTLKGCKFTVETTTTDEFSIPIQLLAGCDHTLIEDCYIDMGLGQGAYGIKLVGQSSDIRIYNNTVKGDYSTANIGATVTLSLEVDIRNNLLINGGSGGVGTQPVIEMITGTTGYVISNDFFCNVASVVLMTVADTMFFSRNFANEDVGAAAGAILRTDAVSVTAMADD